jgi:hypothetical protein
MATIEGPQNNEGQYANELPEDISADEDTANAS